VARRDSSKLAHEPCDIGRDSSRSPDTPGTDREESRSRCDLEPPRLSKTKATICSGSARPDGYGDEYGKRAGRVTFSGRLAQLVRAAGLQPAGRGFESLSAHQEALGERSHDQPRAAGTERARTKPRRGRSQPASRAEPKASTRRAGAEGALRSTQESSMSSRCRHDSGHDNVIRAMSTATRSGSGTS
jgi:hypothetical protein